MNQYSTLSVKQIDEELKLVSARLNEYVAANYSLDITRGKPSPKQLDLSEPLLNTPLESYMSGDIDCRNYSNPQGLPELINIFAPIIPALPSQILAANNSSLELMYQVLGMNMHHGNPEGEGPWDEEIIFLCPSPGYDRHFAICESLGINMIPVPMTPQGPDIDIISELVANNPYIKGMWLVPIFSNPTGFTISEDVATKLAMMPTAAPDFRIFWDNAYMVHSLTGKAPKPIDILGIAAKTQNPNRFFVFASTSKITLAGSGVAFFASSKENFDWFMKSRSFYTIGPDKINQLRHINFLKTTDNLLDLMSKHAEIIKPKFDIAIEILNQELSGSKIAEWTHPEGGYFISIDVMEYTAKRVVELAAKAGVKLTPAGATYPYGIDPKDSNLRLAPTFPTADEIKVATEVLATCIKLAALEKLSEK